MEIKGININFLGHSGFFIKSSKNIVIDPYNISGNPEKADYNYFISRLSK